MLALAREAGERGGTAPCAFNAANEVAVGAFLEERIGFLDIAEAVELHTDGGGRRPARAMSTTWSRPTPRRARSPRGAGDRREHLRLDPRPRLPDLHPRGGTLLRRARRRHAAARVQHRLRPGARQGAAERHRLRDPRDPARRLREDSGHDRPQPSDVDALLRRRRARGAELVGPSDGSSARSTPRTSTPRAGARTSSTSPCDATAGVDDKRAERGLSELERRPERRTPTGARRTWQRVVAIVAGPATNLALRRPPVLRSCFMSAGGKATTTVDKVFAGRPAHDGRPAAGRQDPRDRRDAASRRPTSRRRSPARRASRSRSSSRAAARRSCSGRFGRSSTRASTASGSARRRAARPRARRSGSRSR